jgi:RHS repeat-associated protein
VLTQRPNGQKTTLVWDAVSNLVRTDVLASTTLGLTVETTTFTYDALNRRAETVDARGGVTTQLYDAVSNLVGLVDASPQHNRHTMVYDALNREAVRIDPLGDRTTFAYDAGSLLVSKKDRNDRTREFTFDALGRLAVETWKDSGGATVNLQTFAYDPNSNTLTAADFDGKYTFTYDALDRAVTQQDMFGKTLTYAWDQADNRVKVEDSEGGVTTSVYDADNRLTSRQFSDPDQAPLREDFTYTARDQMASATRYSDVAGTTKVGSTLYTYDASMRVVNLKHRDASDTNRANYTYTYDVADRLTSETRNGTLRSYAYNATDELTGDGSGTFDYDLAGNRNTTGYVTGAKNQYLSDGVFNYFYDGEGNLDHKVRVSDGERTTFTYDHRNQLTEVERAPASGPIELAVEFKYDVFGNRIEGIADLDGAGGGSAVTTRFAYDGLHVWADLDGSSSLTTRRIFGDQVDQVLARVSGSTVSWYLTDRLGSVRELANNTTGALIDEIAYGGFGNVESETTPANGDRYKYTGREFFVEIGLYDYRARTYDATIGRFYQEDPIFVWAGPNLYRYVENSPTNYTDPNGLAKSPKVELKPGEAGYGHHYVDVEAIKDLQNILEPEAIGVALGTSSGPTHGPMPSNPKKYQAWLETVHKFKTYGGVRHVDYNQHVVNVLETYAQATGKKITGQQMLEITKALSEGKNPLDDDLLKKLKKAVGAKKFAALSSQLADDIKNIGNFNKAIKKMAEEAAELRGKLPLPFPKDVDEGVARGRKFAYSRQGHERIHGSGLLTKLRLASISALVLGAVLPAADAADKLEKIDEAFEKLRQIEEKAALLIQNGKHAEAISLLIGEAGDYTDFSDKSAKATLGKLIRDLGLPQTGSSYPEIEIQAKFEEIIGRQLTKDELDKYRKLIEKLGPSAEAIDHQSPPTIPQPGRQNPEEQRAQLIDRLKKTANALANRYYGHYGMMNNLIQDTEQRAAKSEDARDLRNRLEWSRHIVKKKIDKLDKDLGTPNLHTSQGVSDAIDKLAQAMSVEKLAELERTLLDDLQDWRSNSSERDQLLSDGVALGKK